MVPSASVEVDPFTVAESPLTELVNAATGAWLAGGVGPPVVDPAQKLSNRVWNGTLVTEPPRYTPRPTCPADCRPAVELVVDEVQFAGSAVPTFHTLALTVVGEVPVASVRTC